MKSKVLNLVMLSALVAVLAAGCAPPPQHAAPPRPPAPPAPSR